MLTPSAAKQELRETLLRRRRARRDDPATVTQRDVVAAALRDLCVQATSGLPSLDPGPMPVPTLDHTWAVHVAGPLEPPTAALVAHLVAVGTRMLAPVLLADSDLDWACWDGVAPLVRGRQGLAEPSGPRLGRDGVALADVIVVPALAVDGTGRRLGRGGGSYDRALARRSAGSLVIGLLWPDEVGLPVPVQEHDRPVDVAVTPDGVHAFRPGPG